MHPNVRQLLDIAEQILEVTAHPRITEYHKALEEATQDLRNNPYMDSSRL